MQLINRTTLSNRRLEEMILPHVNGWKCDRLVTRLRWSRGAEFSGTCNYTDRSITVNIGQHNRYPYRLDTHVARPQSNATHWWRPTCTLEVRDAYQLTLFVFLHELYHWLIKQARRNTRQKEGRCDRFAARVLVDEYGCRLLGSPGCEVPREEWDFQDLTSFVAGARSKRRGRAGRFPPRVVSSKEMPSMGEQGLLFPIQIADSTSGLRQA